MVDLKLLTQEIGYFFYRLIIFKIGFLFTIEKHF